MPFTGAISNQTSIRSGANFTRHVIIHTPDVICQVQPSANASGLSNAVVTVGTPSSGTVAAIKADYTVLITPSADYANDLQYRPKQCHITYARLDGTGSSVFIGETTFQWTTSQYVTVLKDVRVFQRKHRYDVALVEYRDFDITYRKPKPRIYDLYSEALEISTGSTVSKSFTPSAESMGGGSISSWLWDVDGNTISTGTSSSQNITVDFVAGTHLVSLTVTDSNGVSNKLSILIAVIPADYNSVLATGMVVPDLQHSGDGHVAELQAYSDIEPYVPGSMVIVCTKVNFRDGTSTLTTDMVGWLGNVDLSTVGDATFQRKQSAIGRILDVAYRANTIVMESYPFDFATSPTAWGQLASCTPLDMAWHIVSEMSTLSNVCAIDYPSGYGNQTVTSYDTPNGTLVDVMKALSFNNNKGSVQFAPNGEIVFDVSLPYASSTVRDNATVIEDFSPQDANFNLSYPSVGDFAIQYVNAGGTRYSTDEFKMRDFYGRAPATTENGVLEERIEYMVFPEDTTATASSALTGQLAFDHWHASNENLSGALDNLLGGYLLCRQHEGVWYRLDVTAGDLLNSDLAFDSNTRFICTGIAQSYDAQIGSLTLSLSLREETGNLANYSVISQELLPAILTADLPNMPNVTAYPYLDNVDSNDVYGDEYGETTSGMPDPSENPENIEDTINPPANVTESLSVPLTGQTVTTTNTFASGADYLVTVSGVGIVRDTSAASCDTLDFTSSDEGFATYIALDGVGYGSWSSGGWADTKRTSSDSRYVTISKTVDYPDFSSIKMTYDLSDPVSGGLEGFRIELYYLGSLVSTIGNNISPSGTDVQLSGSASTSVDEIRIIVAMLPGKSVLIKELEICSATVVTKGDGLFKIENGVATSWGGAGGIQFNGANVPLASVSPASYSPSHRYSYIATGTDSTWTFNFVDTDGSYTENSGSLNVTIEAL